MTQQQQQEIADIFRTNFPVTHYNEAAQMYADLHNKDQIINELRKALGDAAETIDGLINDLAEARQELADRVNSCPMTCMPEVA